MNFHLLLLQKVQARSNGALFSALPALQVKAGCGQEGTL